MKGFDVMGDSPHTEEEELIYFFELHDTNRDGFLDGHELRIAFSEHDKDLDSPDLTLAEVEVRNINKKIKVGYGRPYSFRR